MITDAEVSKARDPIAAAAEQYRPTKSYVKDVSHPNIRDLLEVAEKHRGEPMAGLDFEAVSQALVGRPLATLVADAQFIETLECVATSLYVDALDSSVVTAGRDWLVLVYKVLSLFVDAANGTDWSTDTDSMGERLARTVVVVQPYVRPEVFHLDDLPIRKDLSILEAQLRPERRDQSALSARAQALEAGIRELLRVLPDIHWEERRIDDRGEFPPSEFPPSIEGQVVFATAEPITRPVGWRLDPRHIGRLGKTTIELLKEVRFDLEAVDPLRAITTLETELAYVSQEISVGQAPDKVLILGGAQINVNSVLDAFSKKADLPVGPMVTLSAPGPGPTPVPTLPRFMAGIGDLLLVKQTLKAYELGDFAHVENVLRGELRDREHRRLDETEEISVLETEREIEKERDLQSTERNELQNEAEKTVRSETSLDAGLQVTGSYGPAVSFTASLNASFSTSTEEAQRKAASFSREVTERTAERVRERTRTEVRRRNLSQIEERNQHKLDNTDQPDGHIRGIYRWLNKVYDARVLRYGKRMMMDFSIPEPAAYFIYALVENPPKDLELICPEPPSLNGMALTPSMITRSNYVGLLNKYNVTGTTPPPPELKVVSYFDRRDGTAKNGTIGRASKLAIPDGYEAFGALVNCSYTFFPTVGVVASNVRVMLGGVVFLFTSNTNAADTFLGNYEGEIGVLISALNVESFAVTVDVHCSLTSDGLARWKHAIFDSIMLAYQEQKSSYDEKIAALKIQKGIQILGRNPLENRRIERDELKKLIISMLADFPMLGFNAFYPIPEPVMNTAIATPLGYAMRFFENAFEWNNILYVFYPYFWGRHTRWQASLSFSDPDPDFAAFLKAGGARVQLPVRPGFEKAVAHFLQTKKIWNGADPPLIGDDLYLPVIEEVIEHIGAPEFGVPYPEGSQPWEVKVPTSLVLVQDLEEIPGIRDVLTGQVVALGQP